MRIPPALFVVLASGVATAQDARTLFLKNCATCHGETGDGQGTTQLDRPARSFKDGGFSFGNTPEALFRTISVGIPGTPMPAFDSSLSEKERELLAAYVVTLGPPIEDVKPEEMDLAVHDRQLVVRGLLPALAEGLPRRPRGLLIGDPSGITFEYRVDDVRLLALRQGGFVRRTDWSGRGGTPLEPLGKVVHLVEGGDPAATFWRDGKALEARLSGTSLLPKGTNLPPALAHEATVLEYHVLGDGRELAHVTELPSVHTESFGTGFRRDLWGVPVAAAEVVLRSPLVSGAEVLARWNDKHERWLALKPKEGLPVLIVLASSQGEPRETAALQIEAALKLDPKAAGAPGATERRWLGNVASIALTAWNPEIEQGIARRWKETR